MYATVRRLYLTGQLSDAGLDNAVSKKWITQAQADSIRAEKAAQDAATSTTTTGTTTAA